jgi:hypothetical protein
MLFELVPERFERATLARELELRQRAVDAFESRFTP